MAWIPIESNPEVMNTMLSHLGVPEKWQIVDVLSLEPDMLGIIPRPTLAMILLYPTSSKYAQSKKEQDIKINADVQKVSPEVYYLKQVVSNICGSVAIIHSVANNTDEIELSDGFFKEFLKDTKSMTPEERGEALAKHPVFIDAHKEISVEGQSQVPSGRVMFHFVSFVCKDGSLYELDGSSLFPINHGPSSPDSFIEDASSVIRDIMSKDPEAVAFSVCALSTAMED